jgi:hypothetical protein
MSSRASSVALVVSALLALISVGCDGGKEPVGHERVTEIPEVARTPPADVSTAATDELASPTPEPAVSRLDLPRLVLQREDIPLDFDLTTSEYVSDNAYAVGYSSGNAFTIGLREVLARVELADAREAELNFWAISTEERAREFIAGVLGEFGTVITVVEVEQGRGLGDESRLYKVHLDATPLDQIVYYGWIRVGGVFAQTNTFAGAVDFLEEDPKIVEDTLLFMQLQADRLQR